MTVEERLNVECGVNAYTIVARRVTNAGYLYNHYEYTAQNYAIIIL